MGTPTDRHITQEMRLDGLPPSDAGKILSGVYLMLQAVTDSCRHGEGLGTVRDMAWQTAGRA